MACLGMSTIVISNFLKTGRRSAKAWPQTTTIQAHQRQNLISRSYAKLAFCARPSRFSRAVFFLLACDFFRLKPPPSSEARCGLLDLRPSSVPAEAPIQLECSNQRGDSNANNNGIKLIAERFRNGGKWKKHGKTCTDSREYKLPENKEKTSKQQNERRKPTKKEGK